MDMTKKCAACGKFTDAVSFCSLCGRSDLCAACLKEHGCTKKAGSVQKFTASIMTPILKLAEAVKAATDDGLAWFRYLPLGLAPMDKEDWRQWETTPENGALMVADGISRLAAGEVLGLTYTHVEDGPKAGEVRGLELRADGIYCGAIWTPGARASITSTPSEWDGFSPEFYAQSPIDQDGNPVTVNGRVVLRPFRIGEDFAGALTNRASIVGLKAAASMAPNPNPPRAGETPKEDTMSTELEATMKSLQSDFASLRTSMTEQLEAAKKTNEAQAAEIAKLNASRDLTELLKRGRAELKVTEANEAKVKEHFEKFGLPAAEAFVAALPPSAPRGGSVLAGNFGGSAGTGPTPAESQSPHDHVGAFPAAYSEPQMATHRAAIAYQDRALAAGRKVSYREAVIATTRKTA